MRSLYLPPLYLLLLLCVTSAQAAVLRVGSGCQFTTLQAAIDAAQFDDEIRLRTQTYTENVTIDTQLTIRGGYASCSATSPSAFDRSTIQAAAAGAPTAIASSPGGTIRLSRLDISGGNNPGGNGGGLRVGNSTRVEVDLVSVTGNSAELGGGIYIDQFGALASNGGLALTVSNNQAASVGGGIYVRSQASVDLLSQPLATVNIDENTAGNQGGALFFSASSVRMANTSFDANSAPTGGAIANSIATSDSLLEIENATFSNNSASGNGGALRLQKGGAGGAVELIVRDSAFNANQADNGTGFGGALYLSGGVQTTLVRTDFSSNTAARGGALAMGGGSLNLRGGSFSQNNAAVDGGALYAGAGSQWELSDLFQGPVEFLDNTAGGRGGAIYDVSGMTQMVAPGDVAGSTIVFAGNQASFGGAIHFSNAGVINLSLPVRFENNSASADGGAIHATGANTFLTTDGTGDPGRRIGFSGNVAGDRGGAIALDGGADADLDWISLGVGGDGNSANFGGGLYIEVGDLRLRNSNVLDNSATFAGGLYLGPGATALISSVQGNASQVPLPGQPQNCALQDLAVNEYCSLLQGNHATAVAGSGGAILATFTNGVTVREVNLRANTASAGAALAVLNGAEILVENSLVDSHEQAIYVDQNAELDLYQSTLTNNGQATLNLASDPSVVLVFRNSILWGNAQGLVGGASASMSGSCNVTQSAALTGFLVDPELLSNGRGNYRLSPASIAVDACTTGTTRDLDGQQRPNGVRFDIGAFELSDVPLPDAVYADSFE
jgi:predicted outer membrane repeat protein